MTVKQEEKNDSKDFVRFSLFRGLKIISIIQLLSGKIEIKLIRGNKEFKLVTDGNLFLQDEDGNILDQLFKLPEAQYMLYTDISNDTNNSWTYYDSITPKIQVLVQTTTLME